MRSFRWFVWTLCYTAPAAYLLYLNSKGLPLYDPRPTVNLALRFLVMAYPPSSGPLPGFGERERLSGFLSLT